MTASRERLVAVLSPVVSKAGYDLEDIEVAGAGRRTVLRVVIDRDGGFGLDDVADLSRDVSAVLDDADDLLPGAYVLEVSSPGVDRPLTLPRHWRRNADRLVLVQLVDGGSVTGRIRSADDTAVVLEVGDATQDVAYETIARATVQVELRRRPGAAASATSPELDDLDDLDDADRDADLDTDSVLDDDADAAVDPETDAAADPETDAAVDPDTDAAVHPDQRGA